MNGGDERLDRVIGIVLRTGVVLSAALVLIGGIAFVATHPQAANHRKFHAEPSQLSTIGGVLHGAMTLDPLYIIQLGLLVLIATPIVRVMTCAVGFAFERDWTYAIVSLIVLACLLVSIIASGL